MSEFHIDLSWQREEDRLQPGEYSATHTIQYNNTVSILGDSAPDYGGHPDSVNPEQTLAAALSSCQMMTFLALAAKFKWPVNRYQDHAVAYLGKNPQGKTAVVRVELHPQIGFDDGFSVAPEELNKMHDRAHRYCFIANSLADWVKVTTS